MLFPAYAGVILCPCFLISEGFAFPRIRGGDPKDWKSIGLWAAFSPHTRG